MQKSLSSEVKGCTVGVIHIPDGILFFKNRDLAREYLVNRITVFQSTPEIHALKGANLQTGELEGVSIGINRHKICVANTHIVSTTDVTYDILCERLVKEAQQRRDVPRIAEDFMRHNTVQGGRILVSSPDWTYLVEVFRNAFKIKEIEADSYHKQLFAYASQRRAKSATRKLYKPPSSSEQNDKEHIQYQCTQKHASVACA